MRFAVLLVVLGVASQAFADPLPPRPHPKPAPKRLFDRYFVDDSAPAPLACKEDKECINDTVTDAGGCCIESPTPYPQTWAWHTWISTRRQSATCKNVKCPPLPSPMPPAECSMHGQCKAGQCADLCAHDDRPAPR